MSTAIAERRRPHPSMDKRCLLSHRDLRQGCSNYGNRAKAISIPSVLFRQDGNRGSEPAAPHRDRATDAIARLHLRTETSRDGCPQRCGFLATEGLIMQSRRMRALVVGWAVAWLGLRPLGSPDNA